VYHGIDGHVLSDVYYVMPFLHGRKSTKGKERLVAIEFAPMVFAWGGASPFFSRVIDPQLTPTRPVTQRTWLEDFEFTIPLDRPLKLYAGQPDPKDASHFTIRYTAGDEEGFIDGWLQDDDTVKLKQR
jgi:hypothetical protein